MKQQLNLIQELEADICQSFEYGGIPVHLTRTQLRKILAALKVAQEMYNYLDPLASHESLRLQTSWEESIKEL